VSRAFCNGGRGIVDRAMRTFARSVGPVAAGLWETLRGTSGGMLHIGAATSRCRSGNRRSGTKAVDCSAIKAAWSAPGTRLFIFARYIPNHRPDRARQFRRMICGPQGPFGLLVADGAANGRSFCGTTTWRRPRRRLKEASSSGGLTATPGSHKPRNESWDHTWFGLP